MKLLSLIFPRRQPKWGTVLKDIADVHEPRNQLAERDECEQIVEAALEEAQRLALEGKRSHDIVLSYDKYTCNQRRGVSTIEISFDLTPTAKRIVKMLKSHKLKVSTFHGGDRSDDWTFPIPTDLVLTISW